MIYDQRIFELNISKKEFHGRSPSGFIKLAAALFGNPVFQAVISVFEWILMIVLNLPIPLYKELVYMFITRLPGNPSYLGNYLRSIYYKGRLKKMGKNVIIEEGVKIANPKETEIDEMTLIDKNTIIEVPHCKIGKRSHICFNVLMIGSEDIEIGDYVAVSHGAILVTSSEQPRNGARLSSTMVPLDQRHVVSKPIIIKKDGFVGAGTIVMPGTTVEEGGVIGAGVLKFGNVNAWQMEYGFIPGETKIKSRDSVKHQDL